MDNTTPDAAHVTPDGAAGPVDAAPDASVQPLPDAGADVGTSPGDAAADAGHIDAAEAGASPISVLIAAAGGPSLVGDPSLPFETDSLTVTRTSATSKLVLAANPDGTGALFVDDNVHFLVAPASGASADRYYEFWNGYPCPAASTTIPPGGDGAGHSPPIDVSALFSADTTSPQRVTLEFWHCAAHVPAHHSSFYLVEK